MLLIQNLLKFRECLTMENWFKWAVEKKEWIVHKWVTMNKKQKQVSIIVCILVFAFVVFGVSAFIRTMPKVMENKEGSSVNCFLTAKKLVTDLEFGHFTDPIDGKRKHYVKTVSYLVIPIGEAKNVSKEQYIEFLKKRGDTIDYVVLADNAFDDSDGYFFYSSQRFISYSSSSKGQLYSGRMGEPIDMWGSIVWDKETDTITYEPVKGRTKIWK